MHAIMVRAYCLLHLPILAMPALAGHRLPSSIVADFEGRGSVGSLTYYFDNKDLVIKYLSPSKSEALNYVVEKFDPCSVMAIYQVPYTRQITIDGSCSSKGGQIFRQIYQWKHAYSNWCLALEITGQKADDLSSTPERSLDVARVLGCAAPGSREPYRYASASETKWQISAAIEALHIVVSDKIALNDYANSVPYYLIEEFASYVDSSNVETLIRLASSLVNSGRALDTISLLQTIDLRFPGIPMAKFILADAYWDSGYEAASAAVYREYYDNAAHQKIDGIPARVFERKGK